MRKNPKPGTWIGAALLAGAVLLIGTAPASAQGIGGSSGAGGGFGGGFGGGGVGGGFGGGGLSGGSGSGLGGGLAGGTSMSGGLSLGFSGTTGGSIVGGTARSGGISGIGSVQPTNPFQSYYANPLALGYQSAASATTGATKSTVFGQPTYGTGAGTPFGTAASTAAGNGAPGGLVSASSFGVLRAPQYITTLGFPHQPPSPSVLRSRLQGVLERSSALSSREAIRVNVDGQSVLLQGIVASDRERRIAEALVRLEPGVRAVFNQLVVQGGRPGP